MDQNVSKNVEIEKRKTTKRCWFTTENVWPYLVLLGGLSCMAMIAFVQYLFSVIFSYHFTQSRISTTKISWIYNLYNFVWDFTSCFSGPLVDKYGHQSVALVAGLMFSISTMSAGLYVNANYLFISCSVFTGIAGGLIFSVVQFIVPLYFKKRVGMAIGVVNSGLCIGQFAFPVLITYLQSEYGLYSLCIIGAIKLHTCVSAMLFLPPGWSQGKKTIGTDDLKVSHDSMNPNPVVVMDVTHIHDEAKTQKNNTLKEIKELLSQIGRNTLLIRNPKVFIITFSISFLYVCQTNFVVLVPLALRATNMAPHMATWSLSLAALSNFVARVVVPTASDCLPVSRLWYILFGSLLMAGSQVAFILVSSEMGVLIAMCAFGSSMGFTTALQPLLMIDFMGLEQLTAVWGANGVVLSLSFIIIGPVIGFIRDSTGSYAYSIYATASLGVISAILWAAMPYVKSREKKLKLQMKLQEGL